MAIEVRVSPSSDLYLRDPQETELGRNIIDHSIRELDRLGLEEFTFRKLSVAIGCTEASVYRYFASKHQLLLYLVSWYWDWVHYLMMISANGKRDPRERLMAAVKALTEPMIDNPNTPYIDERLLHRVVLTEGTKAYHGKEIDSQNAKGNFMSYKALTNDLANLILEVDAKFPYPRVLSSSLFEMAHNHIYFAEHLPRLTDLKYDADIRENLHQCLSFWIERLLPEEQPTSSATKSNGKYQA